VAAHPEQGSLLYVHVNDAHTPYDPPPAAAVALFGTYDPHSPGRTLDQHPTASDVAAAIDRYDAEISYLDGQLSAFVEYLKAIGRFERSTIVVVGDHGEEFLDHGGVYHGYTLFREQLHVPLVIKLPHDAGAGTRVRNAVSVLDVAPTILAVLGIPATDLAGRTLVGRDNEAIRAGSLPRFAATNLDYATVYAVEDDAATLIVQTRPEFRRWLFERATDPGQQHDLSTTATAVLDRLQHILDD